MLLFRLLLSSLAVAVRSCTVSFVGPTGVRHSVDVTAHTLYEAAAAGLMLLKKDGWGEPIASGTRIDIQVREPVTTHTLSIAQIRRWCDGVAVSPDEVLKRNRVKAMID